MGKHLLIAALFFICGLQVSAQIEKGRLYPGVTVNGGETIQYGIQPSISIGLGKHGLLGVHSSYMRSSNDFYNDSKFYAIKNGGGLTYTYLNFFKKSQKLGWFVSTGFTYHRYKVYEVKNDLKEMNSQYGQTDIYLRPGIFFKASQKVTLFANFGGIGMQSSRGNNDFDLNFGTQVNVGVLINLSSCKRKK